MPILNSGSEIFMQRCFDLAVCGSGLTAPNPVVGAVVVHDSEIIGEGCHERFGAPHAEVNAINSVIKKNLLPHSTLFVSLEPCCHYGKTPPCTDLIIKSGIKNIVVSNLDPNPLVKGKGINLLKKAGCNVISGMLEEQGAWLNRRFFTFHQKKRPYIILKWAQSSDGFFTKDKRSRHWITGKQSQRLVHRWRSEEVAIMVGTNTVAIDNPQLTNRLWMNGNQPIRIILDRNLKVKPAMRVFDNASQTIVFAEKHAQDNANVRFISIDFNENILKSIMRKLFDLGILSVMVEGGALLLNEFIRQNQWDEARIFTGKPLFGNGIKAPSISGHISAEEQSGNDLLRILTDG